MVLARLFAGKPSILRRRTMPDPARATCYYIDHDGLVQMVPAGNGVENLAPKFGLVMTDDTTRIYAGAGQVGGVEEVTYLVHDSGAVRISWDDLRNEWLAPGSWRLIRDSHSVRDLLGNL